MSVNTEHLLLLHGSARKFFKFGDALSASHELFVMFRFDVFALLELVQAFLEGFDLGLEKLNGFWRLAVEFSWIGHVESHGMELSVGLH